MSIVPGDSLPGLSDDYTSQYFRGDVVASLSDTTFKAKVLRCWADEDGDIPEPLPGVEVHPLDRSLKRGEVGISDMITGELSIVPESSLSLHSREFLKGDVTKRSLTSKESAVVVHVSTRVKLEHAITHEPVRLQVQPRAQAQAQAEGEVQGSIEGAGEEGEGEWVDYRLLRNSLKVEARDRVFYNGWIGTVEEVFEDGLIESKIGVCYRLAEMGGLLEPGRLASQVIPKDSHEHLSNPLPPFADASVDRVIDVRPVVIYITWNALNQQIPVSEQSKYPEPKQYWYGKEVEDLTYFDSFYTQPAAVGATVSFSKEEDEQRYGVKVTTHAGGAVRFNMLRIIESRSTLTLRWQDGRETKEMASDVVPYRNVDDYESWPGEHLIWRGDDGEPRPAVVQSFDPHQRVAELLFPDTKEKQIVPALELDPGGRTAASAAHYGVGFGQQVLLCDNNHSTPPEVPVLGQTETPVNNMIARHELASLAEQYLLNPGKFGHYLPKGDSSTIDWWGEVVQLHLDGTITVELPNGEKKRVGLENIFLLNEPQPGEMFEDDFGAEEQTDDDMMIENLSALIAAKKEAAKLKGHGDAASDASWETMDEDEDEDEDEEHDGDQAIDVDEKDGDQHANKDEARPEPQREVMDSREAVDDDEDEEMIHEESIDQMLAVHESYTPSSGLGVDSRVGSAPSLANGDDTPDSCLDSKSEADRTQGQNEAGPSSAPHHNGYSNETSYTNANEMADRSGSGSGSVSLEDDEHWQKFEMLDQAPEDHWFISQSALESANKAYMSRLKKEHKALRGSLPENIIVRTYEDRTDLMRVLIIGPEGTPYADAPFVFDVYLNPTTFPNEPPKVHFHSHTNGHGRCNPNLYEEGKVCLSILGTWSGDASESWNPAKSSLLQVFVSISGLVLVRSPYHCEPAFAKLQGTKEGKVNSRLYSEKAYVLSRSFVRTALERPPSDLKDEIRHLYLTRGRICSVIDHAKKLIDKGQLTNQEEEENGEMWNWNADAMGSLTMGAIITLKRTVGALERIAEKEGLSV